MITLKAGRQKGWERDVSGNELPGNEDGFVELTEEECVALIEVLELKNKLTDLEMQSVYFRGCYDSVGYLKKAGIL